MAKSFFDVVKDEPCQGCSAPCCRMLLINYPAPTTFMEMDYIRFMLGFPLVKMILRNDGVWQVKVEQNCRFLDSNTSLCTVHGTSQQPKTCSYFNPYQCWYKRNYTNDGPFEVIEMDLARYEVLLTHLQFDDEGKLARIPSWEFIDKLLKNVQTPIQLNGSPSIRPSQTQLQPMSESFTRWSVSK